MDGRDQTSWGYGERDAMHSMAREAARKRGGREVAVFTDGLIEFHFGVDEASVPSIFD